MSDLQEYFERLYNNRTEFLGLKEFYKNIDVFNVWKQIKTDPEFIMYISSYYSDFSTQLAYEYLLDDNNILKAKLTGISIINSYFERKPISKELIEEYINFIVNIMVIIYNYIKYYTKIHRNSGNQYYYQLYEEVFNNQFKPYCLLNINLNLIQ